MRRRASWSLLLCSGLVACGAGGTSTYGPGSEGGAPATGGDLDGGAGGDAPAAAPGQLALRVHQVRQHRTSGAPDTGLVLAVTLTNGAGGSPVLLTPSSFKLRVSSGLLKTPTVTPSKEEAAWVDGAMPALSDALAGGASFGPWTLVFSSLDASRDVPVELTFAPPSATAGDATVGDARQATASVTLEPCTECAPPPYGGSGAPVCTYLDRDPLHCGSCKIADGDTLGVYGGKEKGTCAAGVYTCGNGLSACANTMTRHDGYSYMSCYAAAVLSKCGTCVATPAERCFSNYCLASCTP